MVQIVRATVFSAVFLFVISSVPRVEGGHLVTDFRGSGQTTGGSIVSLKPRLAIEEHRTGKILSFDICDGGAVISIDGEAKPYGALRIGMTVAVTSRETTVSANGCAIKLEALRNARIR
jgi:hypothetical protein